jgi:hypothetical protein
MKTVMAEYRAKIKQKDSSSTKSKLDEHHVKGPHIGGVWMGERGKEILEHGGNASSSPSNQGTTTANGKRVV